jgi:hypothetical protein
MRTFRSPGAAGVLLAIVGMLLIGAIKVGD